VPRIFLSAQVSMTEAYLEAGVGGRTEPGAGR
jgi:hypothetical protein